LYKLLDYECLDKTAKFKIMNISRILDRKSNGFSILENNKVFWRTNSLLTYKRCPLYFKLFIIDQKEQKLDLPRNIALAHGIIVHRAVEFLLRSYLFGLNGSTNRLLLEVIDNTIAEILEETNNVENKKLFKDSIEYGYLAKKAFQAILSLNQKIIDVESVYLFENDKFILKLTPDVILSNAIVDLKTTSKPLSNLYIYDDYNWQLSIYASLFGVEKSYFIYVSFADMDVRIVDNTEQKNKTEVLETINELTDKILRSEYEPRKNPLCRFCKYQSNCSLFNK
jgi:CRISPR/Cas system-associated exonuclease Cas4 (RecB family)